MSSEIEQLVSEFSSISDQNRWHYALNLECKLCITQMSTIRKFPSDEELELSIGISNTQVLKQLKDLSHYHFPNMSQFSIARANPNDPQSIETIRQAIKKMQNVVYISKTQILFLEQLIEARQKLAEQKAQANLGEVQAINELVWSLHSRSNATDSHHAYELFEDGEVQTTKGGELYGERSYFQTAGPMILADVFKFPCHRSGFTFAILKHEDCLAIRERMLKLAV